MLCWLLCTAGVNTVRHGTVSLLVSLTVGWATVVFSVGPLFKVGSRWGHFNLRLQKHNALNYRWKICNREQLIRNGGEWGGAAERWTNFHESGIQIIGQASTCSLRFCRFFMPPPRCPATGPVDFTPSSLLSQTVKSVAIVDMGETLLPLLQLHFLSCPVVSSNKVKC